MKIVILNGSARKGNSSAAIDAFIEGVQGKHEIEVIQPEKLSIAPCKGCNACQCYKGCVDQDDTNPTVDRIVGADMILFVTPVYWWGMTGQLKLLLDKCYCKGAALKGKKIGVIVVGGSPVEHMQYKLIHDQFKCMVEYLSMNCLFQKSYYATGKDELHSNAAVMEELKALGGAI